MSGKIREKSRNFEVDDKWQPFSYKEDSENFLIFHNENMLGTWDPQQNHLSEAVLIKGHNNCFRKIIPTLSLTLISLYYFELCREP